MASSGAANLKKYLWTLVNPAYMTRQVNELAMEMNDFQGHITSLNPIRPENCPDPWEAKALKTFERGATMFISLQSEFLSIRVEV